MELKLYNTLTRKKENFKPLIGNEVRIYTCGPTVYNYAHIGNFRTYIFMDNLRRVLEYNGYSLIGVSYAFSERHKDGAERKEDIKGNHSKAPQVLQVSWRAAFDRSRPYLIQ